MSKSLIDLCITNSQEKVSNFGVVHVGISDHSLVFMTRKANYDRNGSRTIEMRQFKNFQKDKFLNDLEQMPWRNVSSHSDPNDMWQEWKNLFVSCMDKHAPLKSKRIPNKRSPWITGELLLRMRRRVCAVVSKVLEKLVYDQLYHYLNDNKLLSSCQSGFRSLHSTITALLEATNSWSVNIDNGFLNGVVFIDLKKAFDTIDHEIILRKMSYFGANQETITWFQSYLSNRTQRCNVNGRLSTPRTITCGVPQGSILGPLLFLMYINDLPNCLREASPRMFADDTNITLTAKTLTELKLALTPELSNLNCWLRANRLSLNVAKTELMIIGSRQRLNTQCYEVDIRIDDEMIKRVDRTKSLGLTIDDRLSWSNHVDEICRKVSSAIGALKRNTALYLS